MIIKLLIFIGLLPSKYEKRKSRIFVSPYTISKEKSDRDRKLFNEIFYWMDKHKERKKKLYSFTKKSRDPNNLIDVNRFISQNEND